jgi:hypothetical protein
MAGRGGRKGEKYELFSFDEFEVSFKHKLKIFIKEFLYDVFVKIKLLMEFE